MARRNRRPTENQRRIVKACARYGLPLKDIARLAKLDSVDRLRDEYEEELELGALVAEANVTGTLFKLATSGNHPAATIFWAKTRMLWRESGKVDPPARGADVLWEIETYQPPRTPEQQKLVDELLARSNEKPDAAVRWEGDRGYHEDEDEEVPRRLRLQ